jgi:DNA-binding NarL/FixJ family response regulator
MKEKEETVLIIEDSDAQRAAQQIALELRGFSARGAKNVAEAREAIEDLGEKLAVMVLDMRLEDAEAPTLTGANLGLEVLERNPQRLPEFLILSAYSLIEYYKLAVRLGAAAYLSKEDTGIDQLVRHVRALLIRRNLSVDDPDIARQITQIAEDSRSLPEAAAMFCSKVVSPVLSAFLGAPHALLINYGRSASVLITDPQTPEELQRLFKKVDMDGVIRGRINSDGPFILSRNVLVEIGGANGAGPELMNKVIGTAFLSVPFGSGIRLSIGILPNDRPLAENPEELANTLTQYLSRSVLEPLLYTLEQCLRSKARREALLIAHTSGYIAEEQIAILSEAVNFEEMRTDSESFRQLMSLSETLRDTGQTLMLLEDERSKVVTEATEMRQLIQDALDDLDNPSLRERIRAEGECSVMIARDDLFIAVSRILQWFTQRLEENPYNTVFINCDMAPEGASVVFEDRGPQLPARSRRRLFSPFAQPTSAARKEGGAAGLHFPLYLAKALVELKHGGVLEDRSDELPDSIGHRFVIRFPSSPLSTQ